MVRILSDADVAAVLDLQELLPVVETAFVRQGRNEVERPERPHFPVGVGLDAAAPHESLGTGLVMPAYVHGATYVTTKIASVHEGNEARGLPTVNATIALTEAATGRPAAYLAGTRITNARTGCIGGLAARELAHEPIALGVIGAGTQARWQTRAIVAAADVESVHIYSPSESRNHCAAELDAELDIPVEAVSSPEAAVENATVVVTATTSTTPVFPGEALAPGTVIIAIGAFTPEMRELDARTLERATLVFGDVPAEAAETGDLAGAGKSADEVQPLSALFDDETAESAGRTDDEELVVVESVGSAVLDAAASEHVLERAINADVGVTVTLE